MLNQALVLSMAYFRTASLSSSCTLFQRAMRPATQQPVVFEPPNFPWPSDRCPRASRDLCTTSWRPRSLETFTAGTFQSILNWTCHLHKMRNIPSDSDASKTATAFRFSFACDVCPSSGQTDSFAPKLPSTLPWAVSLGWPPQQKNLYIYYSNLSAFDLWVFCFDLLQLVTSSWH